MPSRRQALTAIAASVTAGASHTAAANPAAQGERVQWPQVKLLDGSPFGARQAEGKAVVAVFWSTTCPFCKRHNQHLEKLAKAAATTKKPLVVLGISRDRDASSVARYAKEQGYSFAITMDAEPLRAALATRNMIPLTVVIDRQGRMKQVLPGEMFEEDVLELLDLAA
jgi:peroxiredoxin